MPLRNRLAEMLPDLTEIRRDFHRHPELMFDVHRTAARVAELCRSWGCDEVVEGIGRTGVVVVIKGARGPGASIGLRADMDALPIEEATGLPHASSVPGKMHACGHDGHTTMLLGAVRYLAETRNFSGQVVAIFQPAEEGGGGGLAMVKDGLIDRFGIDEVYAMHNMPGVPVGQFALKPGSIMASADQFRIRVLGKGAHAAAPHTGVDTLLVGAQIVVALQSVAARNVDPLQQAVLTVANFETDSRAHNVIPGEVRLAGTIRTLDAGVREQVCQRLREVAEGVALALGARAEVEIDRGYPVTVNSPAQSRHALEAAQAVAGEAGVNPEAVPLMAAEDFSYMLDERPGAYVFLGNGASASLHHPEYEFDDAAIPYGASWFVEIAERRLGALA